VNNLEASKTAAKLSSGDIATNATHQHAIDTLGLTTRLSTLFSSRLLPLAPTRAWPWLLSCSRATPRAATMT
jgi:hypothetical protein